LAVQFLAGLLGVIQLLKLHKGKGLLDLAALWAGAGGNRQEDGDNACLGEERGEEKRGGERVSVSCGAVGGDRAKAEAAGTLGKLCGGSKRSVGRQKPQQATTAGPGKQLTTRQP
jgi:hypothetical protein